MKKKNYKNYREILIDNGFIRKYYYIDKVIRSCETCTRLAPLYNAKDWGIGILSDEIDRMCMQYDLIEQNRLEIWGMYISPLRRLCYDEIEHSILCNINNECKI